MSNRLRFCFAGEIFLLISFFVFRDLRVNRLDPLIHTGMIIGQKFHNRIGVHIDQFNGKP